MAADHPVDPFISACTAGASGSSIQPRADIPAWGDQQRRVREQRRGRSSPALCEQVNRVTLNNTAQGLAGTSDGPNTTSTSSPHFHHLTALHFI
eukprot:166324-Hanusia_phi.AAC.1